MSSSQKECSLWEGAGIDLKGVNQLSFIVTNCFIRMKWSPWIFGLQTTTKDRHNKHDKCWKDYWFRGGFNYFSKVLGPYGSSAQLFRLFCSLLLALVWKVCTIFQWYITCRPSKWVKMAGLFLGFSTLSHNLPPHLWVVIFFGSGLFLSHTFCVWMIWNLEIKFSFFYNNIYIKL